MRVLVSEMSNDLFAVSGIDIRPREASQQFADAFGRWARNQGHDGILHTGGSVTGGRPHTVAIAFRPDQVIGGTGGYENLAQRAMQGDLSSLTEEEVDYLLRFLPDDTSVPSLGGFTKEVFEELPDEVKGLAASGRLTFESIPAGPRGGDRFRYTIEGTQNWTHTYETAEGLAERVNPNIIDVDNYTPRTGDYPLQEGWSIELPELGEDVIYRGMSLREYEQALDRGYFQSLGEELGPGQEGLTYFSDQARIAANYAHSAGSPTRMPTPKEPAVVIAIPRRAGREVPWTRSHEVGVEGRIPVSEVLNAWEGVPFRAFDGHVDVRRSLTGSPSVGPVQRGPEIDLAWREIE